MLVLDSYDYAVPEAGTLPLLGNENSIPMARNRLSSFSTKGQRVSLRSTQSEGKRVLSQLKIISAIIT